MHRLLGRLSRAFALLAVTGLAACVAEPGGAGYGRSAGPLALGAPRAMPLPGPLPASGGAGRRIAILLPLTGATSEIGQAMLKAAQLSLDQPGAPALEIQDTGGTAEGAATAARTALAAGAGIILGPLTAGETAAVAPVARNAGVPVLAFTSDETQAQPGVWTLGVTPAQQVRRLVLAVQAEGKTRVAAVLPQNPFGDALASGLLASTAGAGLPEPRIVRHAPNFAGLNEALKDVSGYNGRRGALEQQQRAARARADAEGLRPAAEPGNQAPGAAPMDALLLGASGEALGQAVPMLAFYDIGPDQVRILGPALWAREVSRLGAIAGAWYAAPDPALRAGFEQQYAAKYGAPPRDLASLAFDAAGVARAMAGPGGFAIGGLTRPEGYAGADGVFALLPDGHVRRGLAIFQIDRGGAHIVQPAPQVLSAPGV